MTTANRTLQLGNYAFSAVALIVAGISLVMWTNALLQWGNPQPYASAIFWSILTTIAFVIVIGIESIQNRGE